MNNWFDIIRPHDDIIHGDFDESVFAADLSDVHAGRAAPDYQDSHSFFKKTFLTHGLQSLLHKAHAKLTEGKGPGVIELQTPFGGGKTHAQIAVYHYVKNGKVVKRLMPDLPEVATANVCVIVGSGLNPTEQGGEAAGGDFRLRTLWGEIAFQLAGAEGYRLFADNDRARIAPGEELLREFLIGQQPFLLLFDEILDYVTRARGVRIGDGSSLAAQTLTFFQQLTNVVSHLEQGRGKGLLLATLPASEMEDFGDRVNEAEGDLSRLDKIFGRLEAIETPVQGEEIYSIIKRRLFDHEGENRVKSREVIDAYMRKYRECQHMGQALPPFVYQDYVSLMEKAYPFHPEAIDILYHKWGTFPKFQRTRGVLRLLANVLENLYRRETDIDLILPGDVNLGYSPTREEFIKHIGRSYVSIIGADISDGTAKAQVLDAEHRGWKHLAERTSTAVFINSFSGDIRQRGTTLPHIRLGVLRPETETALITEVLDTLAHTLWYLSNTGDRYYFSDIPNLNLMVSDMKENVLGVEDEVRKLVDRESRNAGVPLRIAPWPDQSADVPDSREIKVALLDTQLGASDLLDWVQKRGLVARTYKNTLLFAAPNADGEVILKDKVKELLALEAIEERFKREEGSGAQQLMKDVRSRKDPLSRDLPFLVRQMYRTVAVPAADGLQTIDLGKPLVDSGRLLKWFWEELTGQGVILDRPMSSTFLRQKFYSREGVGAIPTAVLLEQFYKEPALPMLANSAVLKQSIARAVRAGDFGVVRYHDGEPEPTTLRYEDASFEAVSVVFDDDTYLVTKELAEEIKPAPPGRVECVDLAATPGRGRIMGKVKVVGEDGKAAAGSITITAVAGTPWESRSVEVEANLDVGATMVIPFEIPGLQEGEYTVIAEGQEVVVRVPGGEPKPEPTHKRLRLRVSGVRAGKIADFNRGVLVPLGRYADDEVTFTVSLDLTSTEGFDQNMLETHVKETIRQIGAEVELEDLR